MIKNQPTILIIFGISGDLASRYLLPAISAIKKAGMLPEQFEIVGITRKEGTAFYKMDVTDLNEYKKLGEYLDKIESSFKSESVRGTLTPNQDKSVRVPLTPELAAQRLFYLSVPPEACKPIVEFLGQSGLAKKGEVKLLLEKPFGTDLASAKDLVEHTQNHFLEEQVYRIDHYLAKEAVQNMVVFRSGNSLFKKTWNKDFIESIEIIASEEIGIEGRVHFYEQTGALRDYVQSHLLQLSALALMDLPEKYDFTIVPQLRHEAVKQLKVESAKRGQYEGYREEVNNPKSMMETFVSVTLKSNDPRWQGVPITLTTGKALAERFTEIRIKYKKEMEYESNELVLRLQPDAGIEFSVFAKRPGYEWEVSPQTLKFNFKELNRELPEAYEQVLWSAIHSDHSLFAGSDEVLESWKILDVIQSAWRASGEDLIMYKKGTAIDFLK